MSKPKNTPERLLQKALDLIAKDLAAIEKSIESAERLSRAESASLSSYTGHLSKIVQEGRKQREEKQPELARLSDTELEKLAIAPEPTPDPEPDSDE